MRLSRAKYLLLFSSTAWFSAPTWWASDGSRPAVILDFNASRYAVPTLGPELCTDTDINTAGLWTAGTGWSVSGGLGTKTAGTGSYLSLTGSTVVVGKMYCITIVVATRTAGALVVNLGNVDGATTIAAAGTYTDYITATATTTTTAAGINIYGNSAFAGTVTSLSVKEVQISESTLRSVAFTEGLSVSATRSGTASTYVDSDGLMKSIATSDVPRFTWLGGKRRLVVEPASTNLYTKSNDFTDAIWAKAASTITTDGTLAPDGTVAAKHIWDNGGTGYLSQGIYSFTSGVPVTISAFFKYAGRAQFYLLVGNAIFGGAGANATVTCDVQAGTVSAGSRSEVTGSVQHYGGGWYRFTMTVVPTATAAASVQFSRPLTNGDGVVGAYVFGVQLEATALATSYIPTAGSTVIRAAEVVTGSALLTALHRRATGTHVMRYLQQDDPVLAPARQTLWSMNLDGGNSRLSARKAGGASAEGPQFVCGNGSAVTTFVPAASGGADAGESVGAVIAWNASNSRAASKGALLGGADGVAWDAAGNAKSVLYLGRNSDGSTPSAMLIDQIVLYAARVSNNALPGLAVAS